MKNMILAMMMALTLCIGTADAQQRPAPTGSPYVGPAPVSNPPDCGFGFIPDAACLGLAEAAYDFAADTAMKTGDNKWNAAVATYNADMALVTENLQSLIDGCAGVQSCIDNALTVAANETIAAVQKFRDTEDQIWAEFVADIQAAKAKYQNDIAGCCTLLSAVDPLANPPQLGVCDFATAVFNLVCEDNTEPDPVKEQACHDTYNAEMAALCANLNAALAVDYFDLITNLQAAENVVHAAMAAATTQAEAEAAMANYSDTFNAEWLAYHERYAELSDLAKDRQDVLFANLLACIKRACP